VFKSGGKMTEMLRFDEQTFKGKTKRFTIISNHSDESIGLIYYYPTWRHYVCELFEDTIWSLSCLKEINNKLEDLEEENVRRKTKDN
jgi:hypothetical protein